MAASKEEGLQERLRATVELLEQVAGDWRLLDRLPAKDRRRLHEVVARLYNPDPVLRRRRMKVEERARKAAGTRREEEVLQVCQELHDAGCSYLSIGQYLAPSRQHYPVQEYVVPERFESLRSQALKMGFSHVESGPYVRSSYHAGKYVLDGS